MLFYVGKALEFTGLSITTFALYVGLTLDHGMGPELLFLGIGAGVFIGGYLIERRGGERA